MPYFSIWTQTGLNKRAQAELDGAMILITKMAIGDGGGSAVTPEETMTALVNEVWRGDVNLIALHSENPNWVTVEGKIPMEDGGFWIREVGLFDADGDMVAVCNYPDTYKPILSEGAGADLYVRTVLATENTATIELTVESSVVMATRAYVDGVVENIESEIKEAGRRAFFHANTW